MKYLPALAATTSLVACFAFPISAMAWGDEGHEVVALVADHYLLPAVRQKVAAMLATDTSGLTPTDIASEATWADRFRDSDRSTTHEHYDQTHQWHFVDIELGAPDFDAACFGPVALPVGTLASNGPAQDCVADKIDQFSAELKDPTTPPGERLLALQFLLHFVSDLHQPLHSADDHDAGGNAKTVRLAGQAQRKLHAFWDTDLVVELGTTPQAVAKALIAKIKSSQAVQWRRGTTQAWALESFGVARRVAYGKLPAPGADGDYQLPPSYATSGRQAVATQLSRAGVRLASVLNGALK